MPVEKYRTGIKTELLPLIETNRSHIDQFKQSQDNELTRLAQDVLTLERSVSEMKSRLRSLQ